MADETLGEIFAVLMLRFLSKPPFPKLEAWYNVQWRKVKPRLRLNSLILNVEELTFQSLGQKHQMLLKIGLTSKNEEVFRVPGSTAAALYFQMFPAKVQGNTPNIMGRQTLIKSLLATSGVQAAKAQIDLEDQLPGLFIEASKNPFSCLDTVYTLIFNVEENLRSRAVGNLVYRMLYTLCPKLCSEEYVRPEILPHVKKLTQDLVGFIRDALITDTQRQALQLQVNRFVSRLDLLEHPLPEGEEEGEIDEEEFSKSEAERLSRTNDWLPSLMMTQHCAEIVVKEVEEALKELKERRERDKVALEKLVDPRIEVYKDVYQFNIKISDSIIPDNKLSVQERKEQSEAEKEAKRKNDEELLKKKGTVKKRKRPKRKELAKFNAEQIRQHTSILAPRMDRVIWEAFKTGEFEPIISLVQQGVDPGFQRHAAGGETALMAAAYHGRLDVVKMLVEAGADPETSDSNGLTAVELSRAHKHKEIEKYLIWQIQNQEENNT